MKNQLKTPSNKSAPYPNQNHRSSGHQPGQKLGGPSPAPKGVGHQPGKTSKS